MNNKNIYYSFPTKYIYGYDSMGKLPELVSEYCNCNIAVLCGKNSAKKLGILSEVIKVIKKLGKEYCVIDDCIPNPTEEYCITKLALIKEKKIDFILAIGGGSVIDAAKYITYLLLNERKIQVGVIATIPASGSESNSSFVIKGKNGKFALANNDVRPVFTICNPMSTKSLSNRQIMCCCSDIMSHLLEQFFDDGDWNMIDWIILGCVSDLYDVTEKLLNDSDDLEARGELVLLSSFALSYFLSIGRKMDWTAHAIEHAISGVYESVHGETLSVIMPKWIEYSIENCNQYNKKAKLFMDCVGGKIKSKFKNDFVLFICEYYMHLGFKIRLSDVFNEKINYERVIDMMGIKDTIGKNFTVTRSDMKSFLLSI